MLMKRLYSADKVADEAQMLAMSKRLLVVDANIQKLVANPKEAAKIMDALKFARDNWGVFFKNPNTNVQQVDTYITEFNQLIMTQYQLVASIAQIPAPKLLKVMPTGFSDVSELVWKDYAQQICSIQDPYAPAFIKTAPPTVPGMPLANSKPERPSLAARLERLGRSTPAEATKDAPCRSIWRHAPVNRTAPENPLSGNKTLLPFPITTYFM